MPADPPREPDPSAIDPRAVRRQFARAAATYDAAAVLQREVGARMMERLDLVRLAPTAILDAGCGTGEALPELAARYPAVPPRRARRALPMLAAARERTGARRSLSSGCSRRWAAARPGAPRARLRRRRRAPVHGATLRSRLEQSRAAMGRRTCRARSPRFHRVLEVGGLVTFTTFGPDTLKELRAAFTAVDAHPHVGRFVDMHDIGDLLVHAGFADPVMQMEMLTLTYPDARSLPRDLKAIGATNATVGRRRRASPAAGASSARSPRWKRCRGARRTAASPRRSR